MTRDDMIQWVLARIDEVNPQGQTPDINPTIVGQELDEASLQVLRKAKKQLVYPASIGWTSHCYIRMNGTTPFSIIVPLPTVGHSELSVKPFIRFLRARAYPWSKAVDDLASVDANAYRQQFNKWQYAPITKPVAAIIPIQSTLYYTGNPLKEVTCKQAVELFPAPTSLTAYNVDPGGNAAQAANTAFSLTLGYKYVDNATLNGKISLMPEFCIVREMVAEEMPSNLMDPVTWMAAGRVLTSLRLVELANAAYANYQAAMQQQHIGLKGEETPEIPIKAG
jgi:hypothetical protein